jgi:hypothetical protein
MATTSQNPSESSHYITDAFYADLLAAFTDWDHCDMLCSDRGVMVAAHSLLYREARYLDQRLFQKWLDLFVPECAYWIPATWDRGDPRREITFANGEIVAAYGWNASVAMLRKQGIDMALMKCKEGIVTWTDGLVMMNGGSGSEDLAYEFINAYMSPEVGAFLINSYGYGSGNAKAYEFVTDERLAELGITDPAVVISTSKFQREISSDVRQKYQAVFDEVKLS